MRRENVRECKLAYRHVDLSGREGLSDCGTDATPDDAVFVDHYQIRLHCKVRDVFRHRNHPAGVDDRAPDAVRLDRLGDLESGFGKGANGNDEDLERLVRVRAICELLRNCLLYTSDAADE